MKGYERIKLKEIPSTNDYAKGLTADREYTFVTAKRQTGGRGTKGRSFSSEKGGVYLTMVRTFEKSTSPSAFSVMASAAVAVCKALEEVGLQPVIKWANDIHCNGKKICGILTENTFSGGKIACSIIGIGVNICNPLPAELQEIATGVLLETGKKYSVEKFTKRLIGYLLEENPVEEYLKRVGYMGQKAFLLLGANGEEKLPVILRSVDKDGELTVLTDEGEKSFVAGEVSLRFE